ncbi:hypothetical protein [Parasphaerochaeta coccoides]|uniref:DUF5723 domain-containing protein n=1 Tax=Parasphaerochaeta coccoides (strain ATCC BAA-1237 / DSM 17374 / SPN1) TaxID=760011 RepID=F4GH34_PARC1|nr:hypothetical protein [Parasphaerochaeta coccoides]AEC01509.1 hypothetical protein Spico_0279 [Parasphaerochaeta coccoides DSM 17374]
MNKKIIIFTSLLVLIFVMPLSAAHLSAATYEATSEPFAMHSLRSVSMGGAGLAVPEKTDGLFINPASLGQRRFFLSMPSVAMTVYNVAAMENENIIERFQEAIDENDDAKLLNAIHSYLGTIGYGKGEIVSTDVSMSVGFGSFGFGIVAQERMHTLNDTGTTSGIDVIAELNAGFVAGYGLRIPLSEYVSLDVGASAKFLYRSYSKAIPLLETVTKFVNDNDALEKLKEETPVMGGYAIPVDVGATVNLPFGLSAGLVVRNLNGAYRMRVFDNVETLFQALDSGSLLKDDPDSFTVKTPWSLDAGLAWTPKVAGGVLMPTIAVDLADITGFKKEKGNFGHMIANHLNIGAELKILNTFDLRFGLNKGYMSVGAGIDLFVARIDATYYWREFGQKIGDKPLDALSVRVNLGFSR